MPRLGGGDAVATLVKLARGKLISLQQVWTDPADPNADAAVAAIRSGGVAATDGVAHRQLACAVEHRSSKFLNNRAESSDQPTRQREKAMKGFRSVGATQRFLASFSPTSPHFRPGRHRMTAEPYRTEMATRFAVWDHVTDLPAAA